MSQFSIEEYQRVLDDLGEEIRRYGHSRQAFELATKSLDTVSDAAHKLRDAQVSVEDSLEQAAESVRRHSAKSEGLASEILDALMRLVRESESTKFQVETISTQQDEQRDRINVLSESLRTSSEAMDTWRREKDKQLEALADSTDRIETRVAREGQRNAVVTNVSLGLVLVVLVLQVLVMVI